MRTIDHPELIVEASHVALALTDDLRQRWNLDGFLCIRQFLTAEERDVLTKAAHQLATGGDAGVVRRFEDGFSEDLPPERRISKIYRFHDREPFRSLCTSERVGQLVTSMIGSDVDVFLSQLVWKLPAAEGQPWHQDAAIFPFDPPGPVIALWIALTPADDETGCLRVVPGSHRGRIFGHRAQVTARSNGRYVGVVDQDVDGGVSLPVHRGDAVLFDARLLHATADNVTARTRVALTFHFAGSGTTDRTVAVFGGSPYNDWMAAFRSKT